MSVSLLSAVFAVQLPAQRKLVLLALADNADDSGLCWPNQETVARKASISERSVREHLHALEADGWVAVLERGNGRGRSTEYRLSVSRIKAEAACAKGGSKKAEKAEDPAKKAEAAASDQPSLEPSVRTVREPVAQAPAAKTVKPTRMVELTETELAAIQAEFVAHPDLDGAVERCRGSTGFKFGDRPAVLRRWLASDMERLNDRRNGNGTHRGNEDRRRTGSASTNGPGWADLGVPVVG